MDTTQTIAKTAPLSKKTPWKNVRGFVIALFLIALFFITMKFFHIEFNATASMPIGFYQSVSEPVHAGSLVSVCLPASITKEGVQRGYLTHGPCPGNGIAVLKQVIALPGNQVEVSNTGIQVGEHFYPAPIKAVDHSGQAVKRFIHNGIYPETTGYWLYGSGDYQYSWDSRYYGPVPAANIQGVYRPLLTFSHLST